MIMKTFMNRLLFYESIYCVYPSNSLSDFAWPTLTSAVCVSGNLTTGVSVFSPSSCGAVSLGLSSFFL
jgi:hypothetical protein